MGSSQALVGLLGSRDPLLWGQQELMELWALLWLQPGNSWHSTCPSALVFFGRTGPTPEHVLGQHGLPCTLQGCARGGGDLLPKPVISPVLPGLRTSNNN